MRPHIANEIKAEDKSLSKILIDERFKIDVFQREYRWQKRHIEALLTDLSISFLNNYSNNHTIKDSNKYDCYYLGPIVLCEDDGSLSIVDGQQRLTSLTLIMIYLNHLQKNEEFNVSKNLIKNMHPYLYVNKDGEETLILNIETRKTLIEHLYNNYEIPFEEDINDESVRNIIDRFEDIKILFPDELKETNVIPIFIQWLLNKVVLVEIKAFSMENAYTIFETMNDRGMNLSPTEMLKGYLLSKINDVDKSYELNDLWKNRILEIKNNVGFEADLDFFRSWLRSQYAESIRPTKQGAVNEDFELIGTQFHTWVKKKTNDLGLVTEDDFYFFIRSDFDFFSSIFMNINDYKKSNSLKFKSIYISNFYPLADSLTYPLYLASLSKLDDPEILEEKVELVGKFIDIYTNIRAIQNKAITQSSIRIAFYELIKSIRNTNLLSLKEKLQRELEKSLFNTNEIYNKFHYLNNWGYYHYFFARVLFYYNSEESFNNLMRNRKQSSYILFRIFDFADIPNNQDELTWSKFIYSVAGHCLIRRWDIEKVESKKGISRIKYLIKQGYLPDFVNSEFSDEIDFITIRDSLLNELIYKIWSFE